MIDVQSIPAEYRHTDYLASGKPIDWRRTLSVMRSIRSDFGQRLHDARLIARLSQAELAKKVGMSQSSLAELETRGKGSARTPALADALGVRASWLADGTGQSHGPNIEPGPEMRGLVPLISWVAAGDWNEASDPLLPGDGDDWLACPKRHSARAFALRVRGDSMTAPLGNLRTYPEGSIIFVDPERRMPVNGDRIVAKLAGSDEVTFKVYKNEDGRQWLQPLNPSHQPIRDEFRVVGTVIGKWEDE